MLQILLLLILFSYIVCATGSLMIGKHPARNVEITYSETNEHIVNPDRGFGQWINSEESSYTPLTVSVLPQLNLLRYTDGIVIVRRGIIMDLAVTNDNISLELLNNVKADLELIQLAKFTTVLRFYYTATYAQKAPYGDTTKDRVLEHIEQIAPLIREYEDIILSVQAGFIGIWGEWYYTTYFGDPNLLDWSKPENIRGLTPQNWDDRRQVLNALLDAAPKSVQVQARIPLYKRVSHFDWSPTSECEMKEQSNKARTGHHNDCFLSDDEDSGTYLNRTEEYDYMSQDNLYSLQGGETCSISPNDRHRCPTALKELRGLRYTYLNQAQNKDVLQTWKNDGCYAEIHRKLGYRFVLKRAVLPSSSVRGEHLFIAVEIINVGYAAPTKSRSVSLVLRKGREHYRAVFLNQDTRTWIPGKTIDIVGVFRVPLEMSSGRYEVLLAVAPIGVYGAQHSDFYVLFASRNVPEYSKGLNNLLHEIEIVSGFEDEPQSLAVPSLSLWWPPADTVHGRLYCGLGGCTADCRPLQIKNPIFNTNDGWETFGNSGFEYVEGEYSRCCRSARVRDGAARQVIRFGASDRARSLKLEADSKHVGCNGCSGGFYSIYCDIKHEDSSWSFGIEGQFNIGQSTWHKTSLLYTSTKFIREAWCYAMHRGFATSRAYFDNFSGIWSTSDVRSCP